jgi:hypothetical protein
MAITNPVSSPSAPSFNSTGPTALDNMGANIPQIPSNAATPALKERPRNAVSNQNSIGATQQTNVVLMAARPAATLAKQRVQQWNRAIIPAVEAYKPGSPILQPKPVAPGSSKPVTGGPIVVPSPRIEVPKASERTAPTSAFFGKGSPVVRAPGVPALQGQPPASILRVVNEALPNSKVEAFSRLDQKQKLIARTMLSAAIEGMTLDPSHPDFVNPKDFKSMVSLILQNAQAYRSPPPSVPGPATVAPSAAPQKKVIVPDLPADPVVVAEAPKDPKVPVKGKAKPATPSAGEPRKTPTSPLSTPPEIAGLTLTPELYNQLIQGANGRPDPVRKANTDNLLVQAQEFRAQIETIDVTKAINPAVSTNTPLDDWNTWKNA